jgi:phenylalanine ammonia-lyase
MQCSLDVNSGTPGTTEPEECGVVWDLPLTSLSLNVIKSMLRKLDSTTTMDAAPRMMQVAGASVPILVDFYTTGPSVDPSPLTAIPVFWASVVSCTMSLLVALRKEYLSGDRGQAPASDYLGRTRPIYEFVRLTLGIRMHGSENESVFANGLGVEDVTIGQNVTLIHEVRDTILSIAQADPSSY